MSIQNFYEYLDENAHQEYLVRVIPEAKERPGYIFVKNQGKPKREHYTSNCRNKGIRILSYNINYNSNNNSEPGFFRQIFIHQILFWNHKS